MALTSDEEADVRALLAAVRKLPSAHTQARSVKDGKTRSAIEAIEQHIRAIISALSKV